MRRQLPSIFLLALLSALPAAAAEPYLVADLDPGLRSGDSHPVHFITLGKVGPGPTASIGVGRHSAAVRHSKRLPTRYRMLLPKRPMKRSTPS